MMRQPFFLVVLCFASLVFCSCGGIQRTGSPGEAGLITIFQKENGQVMYFAGPTTLEQDKGKGTLSIDFTVHSTNNHGDSVVTNFTLAHPELDTFQPKAFVVFTGDEAIVNYNGDFELFFKERRKQYRYRYSFTLAFEEWRAWMQSDESVVVLSDQQFTGARRFKKDKSQIQDQILFPLSHP